MKALAVLALTLLPALAYGGECPSVDQTIKDFRAGMATSVDISKAARCQIENSPAKDALCESQIGLTKDIIKAYELEVAMGEMSLAWLQDEQAHLAELQNTCR